MKLGFLLVLCLCVQAPLAFAEVYRCLSDDGHVSYGDVPCPQRYLSGNSQSANLWRALRLMASEGLKVNAKLGPDVYSIMACLDESTRYYSKLDALETPLSKLSLAQYSKMHDAMEYLRVCGECRVSAPHYCEKATRSLYQETQVRVSGR